MAGLWRRLVEIVRPARLDRETVEELTQHVEMVVAHKIDAGLDPAAARRQARLELGNTEVAREQIASERSGFAIEQLVREAAYAARVLRRAPATTLLSIVTMAVGVGVSGILFALVNGIVLRPLPYPQPDQLVRIFDTNPAAGIDRSGTATGNIAQWRLHRGAFAGIAAYYTMGRTVVVDGNADAVITAQVSRDFFRILGVAPAIGRTFSDQEIERATFNSAAAPTGPDPVAILSHGLWQRLFGADQHVVGQTVALERRPFKVIGVMPAGFAAPDADVQIWIPWEITLESPRDQHYVGAVARLASGVTIASAEEALNAAARDLAEAFPETNRGWGVRLSPLAIETVGGTATVLWLLLASVGLVLLIACANVALLSIIRGIDRSEETAVRVALGASSSRLMREFLIESGLLSVAGGVLGTVIAVAGLRWLPAITSDLPRLREVAFDGRALAFLAAITMLSALLSGVPHAWQRTRRNAMAGLALSRTTEGAGAHRLRDAIVVAQIAIAVVLMMGSGLLLRSFLFLRSTDAGFDPRGVLVAPIFLDNLHYNSGAQTRAYYRALFERLSVIPGVRSVGGATTVPTSPLGPDFERPVWPAGVTDGSQRLPAAVRIITPGYIPTMGLRVLQGRAIDDRDAPESPRVLMVSATLARTLWPGGDPIGQQLVVDYSTAGTYPYEVVGVVGDLRFRGPRSAPLPEIYLPHAQRSYLILNVVIRATGDPRALIPAVRSALREVDPQKPAQGLYALTDLVGATYARDRQATATLLVFATAAMLLAALGVYGVLSQRVRERSREIGIRMAMGAGSSDLLGWVAASGLRLMAIGLLLGIGAASGMTGILRGVLFGVEPTDAVTAVGSLAALSAIGMVAMVIPSWRATRIDPVRILRSG